MFGDIAQDVCLICGHQEEATNLPWHHFAFKPVKEARSAPPNNKPTRKELRGQGSIVLFRWGRTYVVEHRLIEGSSRWGDTDLHESEKAKWARMSSKPPPLPKVVKQRDYTGHIVISCLAVIAFAMFMGWYSKTSQPNTTLETTKSIPNPQSSVMAGLTEQTELLKAKRDAMALSVAEPPHNKKKRWAE